MNTQSKHYAAAVLPVPVSAYSQTTGCFMLDPCVMRLPPRRSLLQSLLSPVSLLPEYVVLNVARTTGGTKLCRPATQTAHTALQQPHGSPTPLTPAIQVDPRYEYLAVLRERLADRSTWSAPAIHMAVVDAAETLGVKLGREHQTRKAG